jgi:hypothetical protein
MKRRSWAYEGRSTRRAEHPFESGYEKKFPMDGIGDNPHTCGMPETDEDGHPNLCCCFIMDADGALQDACYHPADDCC